MMIQGNEKWINVSENTMSSLVKFKFVNELLAGDGGVLFDFMKSGNSPLL